MNSTPHVWDKLFSSGEFIWKEPHELVIRLIPDLEKLSGNRVLDLGCGAGRHLVYLSGQGFNCHGTDIAFTGLVSAGTWLVREGFEYQLSQSEMDWIPYASCRFDAVVCLYVIYHGIIEKIEKAFQEIHRVLKPGGLCLVTFISDRHHRFGCGEEIEANTFITTIGPDAGVPHHFCGEEEMLRIVRNFELVEIALLEGRNEEGLFESHWAVLLEKVGSE